MPPPAPAAPDRPAAPWRAIPRNVRVLALTSFLRDVSSEMLVHLTPLFLTNVLGARTGVVGLIEGLAESAGSLLRILAGWWSDRMGRRKPLTVLGYGMAAAAVPMLLAARGWELVGAARLLDRAGKGIRTAPRDALIADAVGPGQRGIAFGLHRAADTAGAMTGLLGALAVVWWLQHGALTLDAATFRTIVALAIVPSILAVAVLAVGVREAARPPSAAALGVSLAGLDRRFRRFLAVMVLFTLGNSSDAFLVLRAQEAGLSVVGLLAVLVFFNLVYTLAAGPLGALSDRIDRRRLIVAGWGLYALVYLGFAGASAGWHLWVLYAGYALYYAATEGVAKALVADMVPAEQRGTAYGAFNAAVGLAALPASVVAGVLWQGVGPWGGLGPAAPFVLGGALALAAGTLLWRWVG